MNMNMNMNKPGKTIFALVAATCIAFAPQAFAQTDDTEALKIAALEALISAPPERALPLAVKMGVRLVVSPLNDPQLPASQE